MGKREEYAEATRQALIKAARREFAEKGYAGSRVETIAQRAGVATVTVYSSVGGKSGLARLLIQIWLSSPIRTSAVERITASDDPLEILSLTVRTMRLMREEFADVIYTMHDAAKDDDAVAESLKKATKQYQGSCLWVAGRIKETGGLRSGLSVQAAGDILWFYFGYWSWFTLHNEVGWSYERSEAWLLDGARKAILKKRLLSG